MTPCEEIGLKVGDKIRVLVEGRPAPVGSILTLVRDDGSAAPRFSVYGARDVFFGIAPTEMYTYEPEGVGWERVAAGKQCRDLTEQLRSAIAKRDKQSAKAKRHADKLERRKADVQRLIGELEREIEEATGLSCKIGHDNVSVSLYDPDHVRRALDRAIEGLNSTAIHVVGKKMDDPVKGSLTYPIPEGVDPDDPKTWLEGDVVECVYIPNCHDSWTVGNEYTLREDVDKYILVTKDDQGCNENGWRLDSAAKFRFVRRPS